MTIHYSAPLRRNGADYVLLLFIFYFFIHRLFSETTRPILTKFSGIVYSGVVWIIDSLKILLTPSCGEKTPKTAKIWSKFHGLTQTFDTHFKTVKDNSNLKNLNWGIVSLHFWRVSFWTVQGQLRSICPIVWENLYFCQIATFSSLTQKLFNRFAQNLQVICAIWSG